METVNNTSTTETTLKEVQLSFEQDQVQDNFRTPVNDIVTVKKDQENSSSYCRLRNEKQYSSLQFRTTPGRIPVYAIVLAFILFFVGSVMISIGALLLTGQIQTQYRDRTWPLIVIGSLVFLPGFYHLRIAYWAWKGDKNFSFDDIPDFDWS